MPEQEPTTAIQIRNIREADVLRLRKIAYVRQLTYATAISLLLDLFEEAPLDVREQVGLGQVIS